MKAIVSFVACSLLIGCKKIGPASFWLDYKPSKIIVNNFDQGPYGGWRTIHWKSEITDRFQKSEILDFAAENDWTLIDSVKYTLEQTEKWRYGKDKIFPLTREGFNDSSFIDVTLNRFPRLIDGPLIVYIFKTGWITVNPGSDETIEGNGFVVLNEGNTHLSVYHLWGE